MCVERGERFLRTTGEFLWGWWGAAWPETSAAVGCTGCGGGVNFVQEQPDLIIGGRGFEGWRGYGGGSVCSVQKWLRLRAAAEIWRQWLQLCAGTTRSGDEGVGSVEGSPIADGGIWCWRNQICATSDIWRRQCWFCIETTRFDGGVGAEQSKGQQPQELTELPKFPMTDCVLYSQNVWLGLILKLIIFLKKYKNRIKFFFFNIREDIRR